MLAVAISAIGCGERPAPSCPSGSPIRVDLEAWWAEVEDTAGSIGPSAAADRDRLLAAVALAPIQDGIGETPPGMEALQIRTDVEVASVRRGGGKASDRLVAVRLRGPGGAESLRARLLRPLPGRQHLYCPLEDDLSRDTEIFERPCLERV